MVADFLIEEVLDQQSAEMVRFLYATSVVDEFDVELANALLGDEHGAYLLRRAMNSGLFVVPLGGDPPQYRYHQLFRELLHAQLEAEDPARAKATALACRYVVREDGLLRGSRGSFRASP